MIDELLDRTSLQKMLFNNTRDFIYSKKLINNIIRLNDLPLASYRGGIPGLQATNPYARGERKLDARSADSIAYRDYLLEK